MHLNGLNVCVADAKTGCTPYIADDGSAFATMEQWLDDSRVTSFRIDEGARLVAHKWLMLGVHKWHFIQPPFFHLERFVKRTLGPLGSPRFDAKAYDGTLGRLARQSG